MRLLNRLLYKLVARQQEYPSTPTEPQEFTLEDIPPAPYLVRGYGTLAPTRKAALHYLRVRPYLGSTDPVLSNGVPDRGKVLQRILEDERRQENKALWRALLTPPFTHVVRLGWISRLTGQRFDILYLPLSFRFPNLSAPSLAEECGFFLADRLTRQETVFTLCPQNHSLHAIQSFWLIMLFVRFRGSTVDRDMPVDRKRRK